MRHLVLGSLNVDHVLRLERLPTPGETVLAAEHAFTPGGKGANQAVALARLGCSVAVVGAVGEDAFGATLRDNLVREGVDVTRLKTIGADSGLATVFVTADGQSTIVVAPGANGRLEEEDVEGQLGDLAAGDVLVAQLEIPVRVVARAFRLARARGASTVLDPAPASQDALALLPFTDLVAPNRQEAEALTGMPVSSWAEAEVAGHALLSQGAGRVIVKLDREGALYCEPNLVLRQAAVQVTAVDATAAGDAFLAGFLAAEARGLAPRQALLWAARAGALAASRRGAQVSLPRLEEVVRDGAPAQG